MHYRVIFKILGILLIAFSVGMLTPVIVTVIYHDSPAQPFIDSFLLTFFSGVLLWFPARHAKKDLSIRDGFLLTVLTWFILCFFASLPFIFAARPHLDFTNAVFESVSGLTTTGASVISSLDFLPHAIMYYRQQLQFIGGMGIVVLAIAILPMLGVGGMQLYRAEVPGPVKDTKLTPRIAETAKSLWYLYVGFTLTCTIAYWLAGMNFFHALCESFATISTGGFSVHDSGFAYYHSAVIEIIAVIFMIVGATNFSLHFYGIKSKSLKIYFMDSEFRVFIGFLLASVIICTAILYHLGQYDKIETSFIQALFNVTSLATTTGFKSANFAQWPSFLPLLIMLGALIGGCGGSTAGGMKMIRAVIAGKQSLIEIRRLIHPRSILSIKLGSSILPDTLIKAVLGFIFIYLLLFVLLTILLMSQGTGLTTAYSSVIACIANAGAALGRVSVDFSSLNIASKWILIFAMLAGRLEIFTLFILFTPEFWRN